VGSQGNRNSIACKQGVREGREPSKQSTFKQGVRGNSSRFDSTAVSAECGVDAASPREPSKQSTGEWGVYQPKASLQAKHRGGEQEVQASSRSGRGKSQAIKAKNGYSFQEPGRLIPIGLIRLRRMGLDRTLSPV
jgi:hypothetical protein